MTTASTIQGLHINPEYQNLTRLLTDDEYQSLKNSIQESGQWYPIVVNSQNVILDGHHRYKVCQELQIIPIIETKDFEDGLYEELFVIDINLQRRHLTPVQRVELYLRRKPILTEIAKRVRQSNLKQNQSPKDKILPLGKVNTQIANDSGVSREQVRKIEAILEKGPEELKDRVRAGKTSVNYAFKMVTRAEDHKNTPKLPQGQFDIILADPPWSYDINTRGSPDEHYNTMTTVEIEGLPLPTADNAILFLWATGPKQREAFSVMDAWGFTYKTQMVWVKDKIGNGFYVRGKHELLFIGEKGDMPVPEEKNRPASVIEAPRKEHSRKPDIVYEIIEKMYPNRKYLELFARSQFNSKWTIWGIGEQQTVNISPISDENH